MIKMANVLITYYLACSTSGIINLLRFGYNEKYLAGIFGGLFMAFINWIFKNIFLTAKKREDIKEEENEDKN
jgi:hypothetical protein